MSSPWNQAQYCSESTFVDGPPLFVKVSGKSLELPSATSPKFRLAGVACMDAGSSPVPDRAIALGEPGSFEAIDSDPVMLATDEGAKRTTT